MYAKCHECGLPITEAAQISEVPEDYGKPFTGASIFTPYEDLKAFVCPRPMYYHRQCSPYKKVMREIIEKLSIKDPYVSIAINQKFAQNQTWREMLENLVVRLVYDREQLKDVMLRQEQHFYSLLYKRQEIPEAVDWMGNL